MYNEINNYCVRERTEENMSDKIQITNERIKTELLTSDFYYELPEELIAQSPSAERDGCRLMILNKDSGVTEHKIFKDII